MMLIVYLNTDSSLPSLYLDSAHSQVDSVGQSSVFSTIQAEDLLSSAVLSYLNLSVLNNSFKCITF